MGSLAHSAHHQTEPCFTSNSSAEVWCQSMYLLYETNRAILRWPETPALEPRSCDVTWLHDWLSNYMRHLKSDTLICYQNQTSMLTQTYKVLLIRVDAVRHIPQQSYRGPFVSVDPVDKYFAIKGVQKIETTWVNGLKLDFHRNKVTLKLLKRILVRVLQQRLLPYVFPSV